MKTPLAFTFTEAIQPIRRAKEDPAPGETVLSIGWGRDSDSSSGISDVLREVETVHISFEECTDFWGVLDPKQFCLDTSDGKSTCNVSPPKILS